jgi:hypothetical protein
MSLFYIFGNAVGDILAGPSTIGQATARIFKNVIETASPLAVSQTDPTDGKTSLPDYVARLFVPTLGTPIYDLASNRDTFGRTIVPTPDDSLRFKNKPVWERYRGTEAPTSIALAKAMHDKNIVDVSPAAITYFAKFLDGGAVSFWVDLFNPKPPSFDGQVTTPFLKRFATNTPPFEDKETFRRIRATVEREATDDPRMAQLKQRMDQFEKENKRAWTGYLKFSPEQTKRLSDSSRDKMLLLMRDYYRAVGIVKD